MELTLLQKHTQTSWRLAEMLKHKKVWWETPLSNKINQQKNLIATKYTRCVCKAVIQPTYSAWYQEVFLRLQKIQVHLKVLVFMTLCTGNT